MSWLRLDDGFTGNAKISELTDREFRVWMRVLCHCAKAQDPTVDKIVRREVAGFNGPALAKFKDVGLLDDIGTDYEVHDWAKYLPKDATNADRQARWRARRNAARNGQSNGESNAPSNGKERYEDRYADDPPAVTETVTEPSRAGAGTRGRTRPVPSQEGSEGSSDSDTRAVTSEVNAAHANGQPDEQPYDFNIDDLFPDPLLKDIP